ncbi:HI0074 family nucleotidyltransferase substrate-binding subunit [bacterium]|jgi:nucleotidyltransferase substrate binding protein (TIGR01987 family)|nr:HI0074 family nucleotidyltransferase substrate-binding subunit [bacterium]
MKKFENFKENLKVLKEAGKQDLKNEFVTGGIINKFYIQFELSWKVLKELLVYEGVTEAANGSPREIIKAAYRTYDFINEEIWLSMLSERNSTSHVYDKKAAKTLVEKIISEYIDSFVDLEKHIEERYRNIISTL